MRIARMSAYRLALGVCLLVAGLQLVLAAALPQRAAVASAHPLATEAGLEILSEGGNAFDAAVAVAAALAVVEPYSSGIGGGGFFLLRRAEDGFEIMIDAREQAPAAASRDMYLDDAGAVIDELSLNGPLAAGIPGIPAALEHLASDYGRLPLSESLRPAIRLARSGFAVTERYHRMAAYRTAALGASADAAAIFLHEGAAPPTGHVIRQADLAATLERIAAAGAAAFYRGELAERLVAGVRAAGGIWTIEDLAGYRLVERAPVYGSYRGMRIISAPPPSSGGVVLVEALNILERYALDELDANTRRHLIVEAMRRAYRDRAEYLGDPDFVDVPVQRLTDKAYAQQQAQSISLSHATPSSELPGIAAMSGHEGRDTTHFSIIDLQGNLVAATLSINIPFGAAFVPPGTGVLLNDEMDDFSAKPLTPNAYGLIGDHANAIAPGKRPLSSMTPTFVESEDRLGILGTPGGSRIISMVLLGILDFAAGQPPRSWVSIKRYHHQYLPDQIQFESDGLDAAAQADLRARGHSLREVGRHYGNMQAIAWNKRTGEVAAASDPRGEGQAGYFQH